MRIPWIQIDGEAFEQRAPELAAMLDINLAQALGHLAFLWRWGLSLSGDAKPDGIARGAAVAKRLEAGARWEGKAGAFAAAVGELGLLELLSAVASTGGPELPAGLRVKGMDRYAEAWEKQERSRKRAKEYRDRTKNERAPNAHGARTEPERAPGDADADADRDAEERSLSPPPPPPKPLRAVEKPVGKPAAPPPTDDLPVDALEWFQWAREERQRRDLPEEGAAPRAFPEFWQEFGKRSATTRRRAYLRYLRDQHFADRRWPMAVFITPGVYQVRLELDPPAQGVA